MSACGCSVRADTADSRGQPAGQPASSLAARRFFALALLLSCVEGGGAACVESTEAQDRSCVAPSIKVFRLMRPSSAPLPQSSLAAQAEATIDVAVRQAESGTSLEALQAQGSAWECRGRLCRRTGDRRALAAALERALEVRRALIARTRGDDPEEQRLHQAQAAALSFQLAGELAARREHARAVELYEAAQRHDPPHAESTLALARLHVASGDREAAEAQCNALLALDSSHHDEATLMLANIMFQRDQFETALYHFEELLRRKPDHYGALAQLVTLLRRAGRVNEIPDHIRTAEKARDEIPDKASTDLNPFGSRLRRRWRAACGIRTRAQSGRS